MRTHDHHERGAAMVLAIGVLAVITILAVVVLSIVISEKRNTASSYAHGRAFYSADAATEAGVNWLTLQLSPAATLDSLNRVRLSIGPEALSAAHNFEYEIAYQGRQHRPGWSVEYKDYMYRIDATGTSTQQSQAAVRVNAMRLYREGY